MLEKIQMFKIILVKVLIFSLNGAFVVPGFYDNHVHFESTGRLLYGLNLLDVLMKIFY